MKKLIICILILFSTVLLAQEKSKYKAPEIEIIGCDETGFVVIVCVDGYMFVAMYNAGMFQVLEFKNGKLQPKKCYCKDL